ncbi:MAG: hypothetical protein KAK00_08640 [Nanoarchaeota archaeon]|nr:hypothetical protein [Nanoarchaeota archaeon]
MQAGRNVQKNTHYQLDVLIKRKLILRRLELSVLLQDVPKCSSLGRLKGTSNKIEFVLDTYPVGSAYYVEAPGAGLIFTAQDIRRDLLYWIKWRKAKD